jgi:carbon storage regulator CsrA
MLILTRRLGEAVLIGCSIAETIEVVMLEISGSQARLSTEAPSEIGTDPIPPASP